MLIHQSDPKNTRALIGEFFAYHNFLVKKLEKVFNGIKHAPAKYRIFKDSRDRLAHDLWEIIHSDIISVNQGEPNWCISHDEIKSMVDNLVEHIIELNDVV